MASFSPAHMSRSNSQLLRVAEAGRAPVSFFLDGVEVGLCYLALIQHTCVFEAVVGLLPFVPKPDGFVSCLDINAHDITSL